MSELRSTVDMVNAMDRREMQKHCKSLGIKANTKNDVMRNALLESIVVVEETSVMSDVTNAVEKEEVVAVVEKKKDEVPKKIEKKEEEEEENIVEAFSRMKVKFEGKRKVFTSPDAKASAYKVHWTMEDYEKEN